MEGTTPQHEQPRSDATVNTQLAGARLPPRTGAPEKETPNSKSGITNMPPHTRFSSSSKFDSVSVGRGAWIKQNRGAGWGQPTAPWSSRDGRGVGGPPSSPHASSPGPGMSSAGGSRTLGPRGGTQPHPCQPPVAPKQSQAGTNPGCRHGTVFTRPWDELWERFRDLVKTV